MISMHCGRAKVLGACQRDLMMTTWNGNVFHIIGLLWGEIYRLPRWTPLTKPMAHTFDVFFDECLNKWLKNTGFAGDLTRYDGHVTSRSYIQSFYCPNKNISSSQFYEE